MRRPRRGVGGRPGLGGRGSWRHCSWNLRQRHEGATTTENKGNEVVARDGWDIRPGKNARGGIVKGKDKPQGSLHLGGTPRDETRGGRLPSRWSHTTSWPSWVPQVTTYSEAFQTSRACSSDRAATASATVKRGGSGVGSGGDESNDSARAGDLLEGGFERDRTREV